MGGLELLKQARGGGAAPSPTSTAGLERRGARQAELANWCASPEAEGGGEAAAADVAVSGRPSEETHLVSLYVLRLLPTSRLHVNVDLRSTTLPSSCPHDDPSMQCCCSCVPFQDSSMCSESSSEIAILADVGALPEDEQESIGTCTKEKNVRAPASCSP